MEKGMHGMNKYFIKEGCAYKNAANNKKIAVLFDYDCGEEEENCYTGEFLIFNSKYIIKAGGIESLCVDDALMQYPKALLPALGLIYDIYKDDTAKHLPRCFESYDLTQAMDAVTQNKTQRISDMKRFFQAAAFLMNIAENEMKLLAKEGLKNTGEGYEFNIRYINKMFVIGTKDIMLGLLSDIKKDRKKEIMAAKFYKCILDICLYICKDLREMNGIKKILLAGKMFDEDENLKTLQQELLRSGFEVENDNNLLYHSLCAE